MNEKKMRQLVESYKENIEQSQKLHEKWIALSDFNTKITAAYGLDTVCGGSNNTSKVEVYVIKRDGVERRMLDIEDEIYTVNQTQKKLNEEEYEIIEYIKNGWRLSNIAKRLNQTRKEIFNKRNRAIKNMVKFYNKYYKI